MGKITKGVLGGFRGKTGTVIGAKWRGQYVIKSLPEKSSKPASLGQLNQRAKFGMMIRFLKRAKPYIDYGFGTNGTGPTPMNEALSYNLSVGIKTTAGVAAIDYANLLLAKGDIPGAAGVVVTPASRMLKLVWDAYQEEGLDSVNTALRNTDTVAYFVHNPVTNISLRGTVGGTRATMSANAPISSSFTGTPCHLWIFFKSADDRFISNSQYLGLVTGLV